MDESVKGGKRPALAGHGLGVFSAFNAPAEDWPLYAYLKILVYDQMAHQPKTAAVARGAVRLTARRIHQTLSGDGAHGAAASIVELYGTSPHFLRNRLRSLNHGTVLTTHGGKLRRSLTYSWRETIPPYTLASFQQARQAAGGPVTYVHDAYLIDTHLGKKAWREEEYIAMMRSLRDSILQRKRFSILSAGSASPEFTKILKHRLACLERLGLVACTGGEYRLTARGEEATYWYELFLFSAPYDVAQGPASQDHPGKAQMGAGHGASDSQARRG